MKWFPFLFPWCWNVVENDRQWTWTGTQLNMTSQIQYWVIKLMKCGHATPTQWIPSKRHAFDVCNIDLRSTPCMVPSSYSHIEKCTNLIPLKWGHFLWSGHYMHAWRSVQNFPWNKDTSFNQDTMHGPSYVDNYYTIPKKWGQFLHKLICSVHNYFLLSS